ncbi:MAG: hypothetical protein JEZ08_22540 [Clostridiales bacterium]|nr:hypothetical protein [Clostridiales bacterium]
MVIILTDDIKIKELSDSKNFNCIYTKGNFSISLNDVGKVIDEFTINHKNFSVCLQEYHKNDNLNIAKSINENVEQVDIINAFRPTDRSQFNFDMMYILLKNKEKVNEVYRGWFNSYQEFDDFKIQETLSLPTNTEFKNRRMSYMAKLIINSYWTSNSTCSHSNQTLTIDHYYILSLLLEQEELVKSNQQNLYYTLNTKYKDISGKLLYKKKGKFKDIDSVTEVYNNSKGKFQVFRSKFKTRHTSKPTLFTKPSILKETDKIENNTEILNSLFVKGYITNPNTRNHNIPSSMIGTLIDNSQQFPQRYSALIEHINLHGIKGNSLYDHISANYVDNQSVEKDNTHAIIPLPGVNVNLLGDDELVIYDKIVKRYYSIYLHPPEKYSLKVEAFNKSDVCLMLEKDAYVKYGSDIFEMRKESIYEELDINVNDLRYDFEVGSTITPEPIETEINGNLSREIKPLNKKQLLNKLTNMGKKMVSRHLQTKYRHYQIGNSSSWRTNIKYLEDQDLIVLDDTNHYSITETGYEFIDKSKAFLFNIENLNSLYIPIINIFIGKSKLRNVIQSHIETMESISKGPIYRDVKSANYNYIINNYKCNCGMKLKDHANFIGCTNYPTCKFTISKEKKAGDNIYKYSEKDIIELLTTGQTTTVIKDFKFKSGKTGNVTFKLNDSNRISYVFHNKKKPYN